MIVGLLIYIFRDGRYEVEIEGWRYVVPTEAILDGIASPVGGAVVCYTYKAFGLPIPAGVLRDRAQDTVAISLLRAALANIVARHSSAGRARLTVASHGDAQRLN